MQYETYLAVKLTGLDEGHFLTEQEKEVWVCSFFNLKKSMLQSSVSMRTMKWKCDLLINITGAQMLVFLKMNHKITLARMCALYIIQVLYCSALAKVILVQETRGVSISAGCKLLDI